MHHNTKADDSPAGFSPCLHPPADDRARAGLCPLCGCMPPCFDVRLSALLDAALVLEEQARTVRRIVEEVAS